MNKCFCFIAFIVGVLAGAAATRQYFKERYEKISQEEIDSVKEVFAKKETRIQTEDVSDAGGHMIEKSDEDIRRAADQAKEKPDVTKYTSFIRKYIGSGNEEKGDDGNMENPYVISPEEFGEWDGYEKISLTYYSDGVLADDNDEIIDDVEGMVGDALEHFGEYEEDSVFVRCDERRCDYEILLDQRTFSEAADNKPRQVEV